MCWMTAFVTFPRSFITGETVTLSMTENVLQEPELVEIRGAIVQGKPGGFPSLEHGADERHEALLFDDVVPEHVVLAHDLFVRDVEQFPAGLVQLDERALFVRDPGGDGAVLDDAPDQGFRIDDPPFRPPIPRRRPIRGYGS